MASVPWPSVLRWAQWLDRRGEHRLRKPSLRSPSVGQGKQAVQDSIQQRYLVAVEGTTGLSKPQVLLGRVK